MEEEAGCVSLEAVAVEEEFDERACDEISSEIPQRPLQDCHARGFGKDRECGRHPARAGMEALSTLAEVAPPPFSQRRHDPGSKLLKRLLEASRVCFDEVAVARRSRGRRAENDMPSRIIRAEALVHMGELSSARQVLESSALAPGSETTLNALRDPLKRPPVPRDPMPRHLAHPEGRVLFNLDETKFARNLRSAKRGAAGGPSGMTVEHLQPLLDHPRDLQRFFRACEQLARAQIPLAIQACIRLGRLTALQKPNGGVRGIVSGDIVRRLVALTMSQQLTDSVQRATAAYQYAMSTKSGCECIAHALQGLTELDPRATVSPSMVSAHTTTFHAEHCCRHLTMWQEGAQQCHLCRCSTEHLHTTWGGFLGQSAHNHPR